jgi:spore coat polysaccharide biosynthesis protein SpsF
VLATTDRPEDDVLETLAHRLGVLVFRGAEDDVLDRFVQCAATFELDPVIRATADNPCVDIDAARRLLEVLDRTGADYARENGLPCGAAVEGVRAAALALASLTTRDKSDREHVTPFVRRRTDLFDVVEVNAPVALRQPDLRVTVDTWEDLQAVRELYFRVDDEMPALAQLIAAAGRLSRVA